MPDTLAEACADAAGSSLVLTRGCGAFAGLLVARASTSLCFLVARARARSSSSRAALVFLCVASTFLHLCRHVLPRVPMRVPAAVVGLAQCGDTTAIVGVASLVALGDRADRGETARIAARRAAAAALVEAAVLARSRAARTALEVWTRRGLRALAASAAVLAALRRLARRPRDLRRFAGLAAFSACAFPAMLAWRGGGLARNCACALVWHASSAAVVDQALRVIEESRPTTKGKPG